MDAPWPGPGWPLAWPLAGPWPGPWLALGLALGGAWAGACGGGRGAPRGTARGQPGPGQGPAMHRGPCPAMNGHPGRDTDLILRPSESTIDFLSVYIGFRS